MPRKKKVAQAKRRYWIGYCRKSTDTEDKQVFTLQDQAAMIQDYYDRLPLPEKQSYPLQLLTEAQSAYHPGRPVFNRILHMADAGELHGVIVVHPNRISRNHSDSGAFVQRLVDRQIACMDTAGGKRYTGADSNDIFMLTLEGAMSWKDSRDKGDRILQAMRMRAAEGKHMGPVRIGYEVVYRPDGTRVLEESTQSVGPIRRLFELAASGSFSVQNLTVEASALGLRSRGGKKLLKSAIHAVLHDPLYKGYVRFNGILAKGIHKPIVDEAVWDKVQMVLSQRRTGFARPKDLTVRDLFVFGKLIQCPKCSRNLCPYRAKGRYVYYECKNPETACKVCVAQTSLIEQLPAKLSGVFLDSEDIVKLRVGLLSVYQQRTGDGRSRRRVLNVEYEKVQREIGDLFMQRKEAVTLGLEDAVDRRLGELKSKRADLQAQLNETLENGVGFVEKVVRTFELAKLLQEAILYGTREWRESALSAIASNFSVDGKNLILKLRSPFRQSVQRQGVHEWWAGLDDVRTEVSETLGRLEAEYACFSTC